jgi:hypothetical protein
VGGDYKHSPPNFLKSLKTPSEEKSSAKHEDPASVARFSASRLRATYAKQRP